MTRRAIGCDHADRSLGEEFATKHRRFATGSVALAAAVALIGSPPAHAAGTTQLVSLGPSGARGNCASFRPSVSGAGRYVAFQSCSSTFGASGPQIYLRDRQAHTTTLVSAGRTGGGGNHGSFEPAISSNGRYVAFASAASNLVANDPLHTDVFRYDRVERVIKRVSMGRNGQQPDDDSGGVLAGQVDISSNGRYVAFVSSASNLVAGDTNGVDDVFVRDMATGKTMLASPGVRHGPGDFFDLGNPSISGDGRYVAFATSTPLLPADHGDSVDVYVRDLVGKRTIGVTVGVDDIDQGDDPALSGDGTKVAFVDSSSTGGAPSQVWTADLGPSVHRPVWPDDFTLVSAVPGGGFGDDDSFSPAIDQDGGVIAFDSAADDLLHNDGNGHTDAFVSRTGMITRASVNDHGQAGTDESAAGVLACIDVSADGTVVAFESLAPNLVPDDTNATFDVFARIG